MTRYLLQRANLSLRPVDQPVEATRLFGKNGCPVTGMRLTDPQTDQQQRLDCRIYLQADRCFVFLERPTPLRHEVYGDLEVAAGWWEACCEDKSPVQSDSACSDSREVEN